MIDEKKLIECLAYDMSCFETEDKKISQLYVRVDDMLRMINGQPKIGEWIPCSERLPEEEGNYLVTRPGYREWITDTMYFRKGSFTDKSVCAWQPLQAPYEVKSDE